ncbi:MAG: exosortase H [Sedimenticola sp.]|jgi:exosortase H (IPTLxxWG-CTERM-specific)|nr:MAG: exosortase H [Sedimenticola sp.]
MLKFFLLFLLIQAGLFTAELVRPVQQHLVIPFTEGIAAISAWLVKLFDDSVFSQGIVIRDMESGFAVAIEAGCNGVEATIVLVAALLAFSAPWKHKLWGIVIGFLAIQGLNLLRIISLFYLGQWNKTAFEWAHLYIWQALIMLDVLIIFLIWLRYLPQRPATAGQPRAA